MSLFSPPSGLRHLLTSYLFDRRRWKIWSLFAVVLAAYGVNIKLAVMYNDWNGRFFDALQAVNKEAIFRELYYFIVLAAVIIVLLVWAQYVKDRLRIALRRDLTEIFFARWLSADSAHYLLRESGKEPDNPDQRISEDVHQLVNLSVNLSVSFYDSMLTIGSFSVILWQLSGSAEIFGITIPGYMFWVCILYTIIATWITHLIGYKLKGLNINAQHMEANLRAALMEKRRHADAIAGAKAEGVERKGLTARLSELLDVLIAFVKRKRDLNLFTVGVGQFTHLAPIFFSLPSFFAGVIQLGGVMQIRGAFNDVARSLSWIIMSYDDLAALAAAYERLRRLEQGLAAASRTHQELASRRQSLPADGLEADLTLSVPNGEGGTSSAVPAKLNLRPGTLTIITGPSGVGKSTLLKVLAGFGEHFEGQIAEKGSIFWMPQTPYLPRGELIAALAYPLPASGVTQEEATRLLAALHLSHLAERLYESADWANVLSGGEQQRICLLRALLQKPAVLLLDEQTSGLDPDNARHALEVLRQHLPNTAIVLVTHQQNLWPLADQVIRLQGESHG